MLVGIVLTAVLAQAFLGVQVQEHDDGRVVGKAEDEPVAPEAALVAAELAQLRLEEIIAAVGVLGDLQLGLPDAEGQFDRLVLPKILRAQAVLKLLDSGLEQTYSLVVELVIADEVVNPCRPRRP
ncbi:MAG: hypothetical protein AAB320_04785 [Elusimicrobiota bacterium]